jgi:hypothetical protein
MSISAQTKTPCPKGESHQYTGPIPKTRVAAMRRHRREGRTREWIASHYGISVGRVLALTAGVATRGRPTTEAEGARR